MIVEELGNLTIKGKVIFLGDIKTNKNKLNMDFKIYYDKDFEKAVVETETGKHLTDQVFCGVITESLISSDHPKMCLIGSCQQIIIKSNSIKLTNIQN